MYVSICRSLLGEGGVKDWLYLCGFCLFLTGYIFGRDLTDGVVGKRDRGEKCRCGDY